MSARTTSGRKPWCKCDFHAGHAQEAGEEFAFVAVVFDDEGATFGSGRRLRFAEVVEPLPQGLQFLVDDVERGLGLAGAAGFDLAPQQGEADGAGVEPVVDLVFQFAEEVLGGRSRCDRVDGPAVVDFLAEDRDGPRCFDAEADDAGLHGDDLDRRLDRRKEDFFVDATG